MGDMKRVVVIGGGAAGLAGALALQRAAEAGEPVDWVLLEKDDRLGGKILTERRDGFIIDGGPDCYLSEKPWVGQMAARLGITNHLLPSNDAEKRTFIYARGRLHELPDGIMMMVPTKFLPLATTSLFSWPGKVRMGLDLFIPKRVDGSDETLGSFVRRRLGRECLELLAEPMVGGVHASDPEQMSLKATFPRFLQMEERHGSLIRAFLAARCKAPPRPAPRPGTVAQTYFMTFQGGMQELTDAVADAAGRQRMRSGRQVIAIEERTVGRRYLVRMADGESCEADALIVSSEAHQAARFLRDLDGKLAETLGQVLWSSAATVSLAYRRDRLGHELHGFGFLVPAVAQRQIMASTWSSTKWPGRAPDGYALIRAFVGGPHNGALVELEDDAMVAMVRQELGAIMGITAEPEFGRVYRWPKGMPQYTVGHLDRLAAIERRLKEHPGLYLCGASYRGVGMGDCMNSAEQAVAQALALVLGYGYV